MKTNPLLLLIVMLSFNTIFAQKGPSDDLSQRTNLELPNIQVIPIQDTQSQRQYELYIKLPEGYADSNATHYPVLYFTDALWHIEILSGSSEYLMDNLILVGISWEKEENPGISRYRDYSLIKSMHPKYQSGDAANHLAFIQNNVFGYVENNFHTQANNRTYFGYSRGGMFGAYILLHQPNTFKNYILGSPETLLDDSYIHQHSSVSDQRLKETEANVFISCGALEREDLLDQARELGTFLNNYPNISLESVRIEAADHSTAFPMTSVKSMYWLSDLIKDNENDH